MNALFLNMKNLLKKYFLNTFTDPSRTASAILTLWEQKKSDKEIKKLVFRHFTLFLEIIENSLLELAHRLDFSRGE